MFKSVTYVCKMSVPNVQWSSAIYNFSKLVQVQSGIFHNDIPLVLVNLYVLKEDDSAIIILYNM
jgi:hypothetical protein